MQLTDFSKLDVSRLPSPCFIVDEVAINRNLAILNDVQQRSGAKVLAALKAFSLWALGERSSEYLSGICASGLYEAKLGYEEYCNHDNKGEVHVFSAAYSEQDLQEILSFADHVVFNSCSQWQRFQPLIKKACEQNPKLSFGLRINPEHSEGEVAIYDPCAPGSRLGITLNQLDESSLQGISGLHFHTLCEQLFEPLERTLNAVEQKFGYLLHQMEWVNFGGGHHITHPDYDIDALVERIKQFKAKYNVDVYLEPGEAVAIGTGVLSTQVLDIGFNELPQAILNTSATCHMPDTLEMPYRADIINAGLPQEYEHTYRLGGLTCLAGDIIGDYSFKAPLEIGQHIIFEDMAHYTMVKTSMFNGTALPAIAIWNSETDVLRVVKEFSYADFKHRLS